MSPTILDDGVTLMMSLIVIKLKTQIGRKNERQLSFLKEVRKYSFLEA